MPGALDPRLVWPLSKSRDIVGQDHTVSRVSEAYINSIVYRAIRSGM